MLFSSLGFILLFLPATGAAFALFRRWRIPSLALGSLALASLVFYCWWKPGYLPLFVGSVVVNFIFGWCIRGPDRRSHRVRLFGLVANLGFLIWFTLVDAGFAQPTHLQTVYAWLVLVAFAVQPYFDFSGYSDMAIGLWKMFGVALP